MTADRADGPVFVVMAHTDPDRLSRLIAALDPFPVVVHWDRKSADAAVGDISRRWGRRVSFAPRVDARLASWSLVEAELGALRHAARHVPSASHVVVMSGSDYPLRRADQLAAAVTRLGDESWFENAPLPFTAWRLPVYDDGGWWRFRFYFPTLRDHVLMTSGKPVCVPARRRVPADLSPRASSAWKILSRRDLGFLLTTVAARPDLVRYARHTFTPEESFLASLLASASLRGTDALGPCAAGAWLIRWPRETAAQHPHTFTDQDLDDIAAHVESRRATETPLLFIRKLPGSRESRLPDLIDRHLRVTVTD